jgi:AcrR family transcriptional regulator
VQKPAPPVRIVRPTRADARRNFDRLVATADALFAEQGTDVSFDEIARNAGVGSGTLYRHFPTRNALMTAVFWGRVEEQCAEAERLLDGPSADVALTTWLGKLIELTMQRGLAQALTAGRQDDASALFAACREALERAAAPLLRRAQDEGSFREDLAVSDLMAFAHAIALVAGHSEQGVAHAARLLDLLVSGLRSTRESRVQT